LRFLSACGSGEEISVVGSHFSGCVACAEGSGFGGGNWVEFAIDILGVPTIVGIVGGVSSDIIAIFGIGGGASSDIIAIFGIVGGVSSDINAIFGIGGGVSSDINAIVGIVGGVSSDIIAIVVIVGGVSGGITFTTIDSRVGYRWRHIVRRR
jgi:hypothetical protein